MKGRMRTQKGITLIALIITIVVLLILAVVAITSIEETDIIGHAENSTGTYNNAVKNEQSILNGYVNYLDNGGFIQKISFYLDCYGAPHFEVVSGTTWGEFATAQGWSWIEHNGETLLLTDLKEELTPDWTGEWCVISVKPEDEITNPSYICNLYEELDDGGNDEGDTGDTGNTNTTVSFSIDGPTYHNYEVASGTTWGEFATAQGWTWGR